jgi:TrkA domain protein
VGLRHDFRTRDGMLIGVISHRSGRSEVFVCAANDPDTPLETFELTEDERRALVEILGGSKIVQQLSSLQQHVEGLAIDWIPIPENSPYAGRPLGDTAARSRTGVSIVAVLRNGSATPAPGPEVELASGDTLVVVGTAQGIQRLTELLLTG